MWACSCEKTMKYESTHWLLYCCIGVQYSSQRNIELLESCDTVRFDSGVEEKVCHTLSAQTVLDIHWIERYRLLDLCWVKYTTEIETAHESSSIIDISPLHHILLWSWYINFYIKQCKNVHFVLNRMRSSTALWLTNI